MSVNKKPKGYETYRLTSELATYLGVTRKTILRWCKDNHIKASTVLTDGTRLFSQEDCALAMEYRRSQLSSERANSRRIT